MVAVDTHYYGKQVIAPLNIVLYNVFGQGGPDLYGKITLLIFFFYLGCFIFTDLYLNSMKIFILLK